MKLTAQFTARCGSSFPATILKHESHNYQFNFLKHNHSLYPLFNTLVNHYSKIITPPKHVLDKITKAIVNKYDILDDLMIRVRYQQYEENQHIETEKGMDQERSTYAYFPQRIALTHAPSRLHVGQLA